MASQKKIFNQRQNGGGPNILPPPFELPNEKIEVKVQLVRRINSILRSVESHLLQHNMDNVSPDPLRNSITISGYPPVNGFDQHTVLTIVQRYDPHASLLPSRF